MIQKLSDYIAKNGDREIDSEKLDDVLQIKKNEAWKPENGDTVWLLISCEDAFFDVFDDENIDYQKLWEIGMLFPTEEAVQAHFEYLKTKTALKRYAQEHNEGEIDWENVNQVKHCLFYAKQGRNKIIIDNETYFKQAGQIYFTSEKIAQAAIKEIGEEKIKRYLLYEG